MGSARRQIVALYLSLFVFVCLADINEFYRKLARQRKESRVEDLEFKISSSVVSDHCRLLVWANA